MSRTAAAELVRDGRVLLDGRPTTKSMNVKFGQVVEILEAQKIEDNPSIGVPENLPIVELREDYVVVDKPAGLAAHPSVGWEGSDVLAALAAQGISVTTSGAAERQGIVQRLDVGTSGLMVVARTEHSYSRLKQQFRNRQVDKTYHAVVQGHPDPAAATIDSPIARSKRHDYKFVVDSVGKPAITHYSTLELMARAALLEIKLETGRTHQIRVHFSAFNHPLIGDPLYGGDPKLAAALGLDRQWLHAVGLSFRDPSSGEMVTFSSEYSTDLRIALERLRRADFSL